MAHHFRPIIPACQWSSGQRTAKKQWSRSATGAGQTELGGVNMLLSNGSREPLTRPPATGLHNLVQLGEGLRRLPASVSALLWRRLRAAAADANQILARMMTLSGRHSHPTPPSHPAARLIPAQRSGFVSYGLGRVAEAQTTRAPPIRSIALACGRAQVGCT
jgi:hypothetical protein